MAQKAFHMAGQAAAPSKASPAKNTGKVIPFRQKLLPRHRHYLAQWLAASERMGILDASIEATPGQSEADMPLVVVWVRENTDPAYTIHLDGAQWVLLDCLRDNELARCRDLSEALHIIRPVLPLQQDEAAFC